MGETIAERLQDFAAKLKSGEPIEATRVERFNTPDGPMHVRAKVVLEQPKSETESEGK